MNKVIFYVFEIKFRTFKMTWWRSMTCTSFVYLILIKTHWCSRYVISRRRRSFSLQLYHLYLLYDCYDVGYILKVQITEYVCFVIFKWKIKTENWMSFSTSCRPNDNIKNDILCLLNEIGKWYAHLQSIATAWHLGTI